MWIQFAVTPLIAVFALSACTRGNDGDPGKNITVSGTIEVVDAQLSFKIPGRLVERTVDEGDRVSRGRLIARLDDQEIVRQIDVRRAEVDVARAALAELEAGSRPQEIAAAEATLRSAEADRDRARLEYERQRELRRTEAVAQRELDNADAQFRVAEARAAESAQRLSLLREGARAETIAQGRARVAQSRAALALAEVQLDNTHLSAPFDGVVLEKHAEPGEFLGMGAPVVTVADTFHVWLRAYLNQTDLGRVQLGQEVGVRTDSFPGKSYRGRLSFISSEAEFTPKTVQTTKERVTLVFRIKIDLDNISGELKPGMAADAILAAGEPQ